MLLSINAPLSILLESINIGITFDIDSVKQSTTDIMIDIHCFINLILNSKNIAPIASSVKHV